MHHAFSHIMNIYYFKVPKLWVFWWPSILRVKKVFEFPFENFQFLTLPTAPSYLFHVSTVPSTGPCTQLILNNYLWADFRFQRKLKEESSGSGAAWQTSVGKVNKWTHCLASSKLTVFGVEEANYLAQLTEIFFFLNNIYDFKDRIQLTSRKNQRARVCELKSVFSRFYFFRTTYASVIIVKWIKSSA